MGVFFFVSFMGFCTFMCNIHIERHSKSIQSRPKVLAETNFRLAKFASSVVLVLMHNCFYIIVESDHMHFAKSLMVQKQNNFITKTQISLFFGPDTK